MRIKRPKKVYNPIERYKIWLEESAKYFKVKEDDIINGFTKKEIIKARHTFYWLCWKDNINLPDLSRLLGKHRSTIAATMNNAYQHRDNNAENKIYEKITSQKEGQVKDKNHIY